MKRSALPYMVLSMFVILVFAGCATMGPVVGKAKPPIVTLEHVEIATIQPFYMVPRIGFKDCKNPGKVGKYGYSSTLNVAYILNMKNPNAFPIMLEDMTFTTAFDGFDVNTPMVYEDQWIPAGKSNQLRVVVTNEAFNTMVSLMVGSMWATKIKKMGTTQGAVVKKWWTTIGDFAFPITVKGTATFVCPDGSTVLAYFKGKFPK